MVDLNLSDYINKLNQPCIFKKILSQSDIRNSACNWTPVDLINLFKNENLTFRIGRKTNEYVQFENECSYVKASVSDFFEWVDLNEKNTNSINHKRKFNLDKVDQDSKTINPFLEYDNNEYWAYADYKYMIELIQSDVKILNEKCIDWGEFGFLKRDANDSTMWLGSAGAYTPCHYDAYGYNLVAQIFGSKRWIMFPTTDSDFLYPTRIPFEESTIYSRVNIKFPDLQKFSKFKNVQPYIVDLEPGDVLYVPHNWWHYVENLTDSISINTWVEIKEKDDFSRLKEIVAKSLLQSIMESNMIDFEKWINSSEDYFSQEENMQIMNDNIDLIKNKSLDGEKLQIEQKELDYHDLVTKHPNFYKYAEKVSFEYFIKEFTFSSKSINKMNSPKQKIKKAKIGENHVNKSEDLASNKKFKQSNENSILDLAMAVTSPNIIESITKNFLINIQLRENY